MTDRIAVVIGNGRAVAGARVNPSRVEWEKLEAHAARLGCKGPYVRTFVECDLAKLAAQSRID